MRIIKLSALVSVLILFVTNLNAQPADSLVKYVDAGLAIMEKHSLYTKQLNWNNIRDSVKIKLQTAVSARDADAAIIWAFKHLKDDHGFYSGMDSAYRYVKPGPERKFSPGLLAAYQEPRAVKTLMLPGKIGYYKMPAVLIGSNLEKMKLWANMLTDSLCKLQALHPRAYIIDLRMNNGGNSEPMWQAFHQLIGEDNRTFMADADKNILPEENDSTTIAYKSAARPDRPCFFKEDIAVAVLIGPGTASSGEIMALSFTTRKNTKLFGEPTIGVAGVTNGFTIQDKGHLLLTVGYVADANKKVLETFQVKPSVFIEAADNYADPQADITVQGAVKWLNNMAGK